MFGTLLFDMLYDRRNEFGIIVAECWAKERSFRYGHFENVEIVHLKGDSLLISVEESLLVM